MCICYSWQNDHICKLLLLPKYWVLMIRVSGIEHSRSFWAIWLETGAFIYLSPHSPSYEIEGQLNCPQTSQMNYSRKVHYKVRWQLLQSATAFFMTKCDNLLLQSATAFLLQSVISVITKCDRYYKVRRFYYKVRRVWEMITTKCDRKEAKPVRFGLERFRSGPM